VQLLKWIWIAGISMFLNQMNAPDRLSVQYRGETLISVNRADYTLPALPVIDANKFDKLLATVDRQIYQEPVNAKIGDHGNIIPEQIGYKLDRRKFTDQFYAYFFGSGSVSIEVPRAAIYPKVDSELLAFIREKQIGQYVTYFNAGNKNRSHNIALAAKAINNHIVFPNERFSFNRIVGKRVKEKGYLRAPVIVRGELAEDVGGGICQVSSTLFNAVDRAGLQIVERYSHSRHVPYVPPGRDATVSWYGPDFAFQNQYHQPVLIRAFVSGGTMFVSIYSSEIIDYKPKQVRSMSKRLPEEISIEKLAVTRFYSHFYLHCKLVVKHF
jgi:vancomycin resistance protein YoaR